MKLLKQCSTCPEADKNEGCFGKCDMGFEMIVGLYMLNRILKENKDEKYALLHS